MHKYGNCSSYHENVFRRMSKFDKMKKSEPLPKLITHTWKHKDTSQEHPLTASVVTLRLLGRLPLIFKSGKFSFYIYSWWTLYCLVFMTIQLGLVLVVFYQSFSSKIYWSSFDITIRTLMNLSILVTVPQNVVLTWRKASVLTDSLNQWKSVQRTFQVVTGRRVSSLLIEHQYWVVGLISFSTIFLEFLPTSINYIITSKDGFNIHVLLIYGVTVWYLKLVLCTWLMHTHSVSQAAKLLKDSLVELGRDFVVKLLSYNYHLFSEDQLDEVELFLYTVENLSERFQLDGMMELTRTTLIGILETALTIMVVLLQFRMSA